MYTKIFEEDTVPSADIILPYKIFFQIVNCDKIKIYENNKFNFEIWREICDFIKKSEKKTGNFYI